MKRWHVKGLRMAVSLFWVCLLVFPLHRAVADPPGAPGVPVQLDPKKPLTWGQMPGPSLTAPGHGQKFQLLPGLQVEVKGSVVDWFVKYAKESPFQEKWFIEVLREGPGGSQVKAGSFSGDINATTFGTTLSQGWFQAHGGPGKYVARVFVGQMTRFGSLSGPYGGFAEFEIVPPLTVKPDTGPVAPTQPKGLPDITSGSGVTIGGKIAAWGSSVTVDAKDALSVNMNNSGLCEFGIKHMARNVGLASTGGFDSLWKNSAVPGSASRFWLPIEPGGAKEETDLVRLKAGQNLLHLTLDNLSKVQELNENNNKFRIIVNVTGSCGPKPGLVPPPKGGEQSGPPASPRAPAVR